MPDNNYQDIGEQVSPYESSVTITLYKSTAEPNRINKTNYINLLKRINGTFKEPFNLTNPTVTILRNDLSMFNYAEIRYPHSGTVQYRYYFVTNITAITAELYEIDLQLDVLMTYKDAIRNCIAFVERNEFTYNNLIPDKKRIVKEGLRRRVYKKTTPLFEIRDSSLIDDGMYVLSGYGIGSRQEEE